MSCSGASGCGVCSASQAPHHRSASPRLRASAFSRLVLPMPASPAIRTVWPVPPATRRRRSSSPCNSASRSTSSMDQFGRGRGLSRSIEGLLQRAGRGDQVIAADARPACAGAGLGELHQGIEEARTARLPMHADRAAGIPSIRISCSSSVSCSECSSRVASNQPSGISVSEGQEAWANGRVG